MVGDVKKRLIRSAMTRAMVATGNSPVGGQQPVALRPFADFVELADDARPDILAPVVELFLQLVFEQLALFLDDEDLFQPFGEVADAFRFQRPDHADLVEPDADFGGERVVDAELVQGLPDIEIALAGRQDAEPRGGRVDHHAVQLVGPA
jgi:hypothetical protein